ncbi:MAG: OsmC family protein [Candidatus Cloacimonetes bacterium]|nr:OsmC family protein [Candidatus Cloacimonadota bacterium]
MKKTRLIWEDGLSFAVEQDSQKFHVDGDPEHGGKEKGPRPKTLLLTALAGCSGMDAVSILQKMRIPEFKLIIDVEGETVTEHPTVFKDISLLFRFEGNDLPIDKLKRAVELGTEKYCPVYAMLIKSVPIETRVYLNGKEV